MIEREREKCRRAKENREVLSQVRLLNSEFVSLMSVGELDNSLPNHIWDTGARNMKGGLVAKQYETNSQSLEM